jgi:lysozyme
MRQNGGEHLTKRYEDSSNSVIRCLRTDGGRLTMPEGKIFISRALTAVVLTLGAALSGCGGAGPMDVADLPRGMVNSNYPKPHDYPVHGIDVSKFQGDIDWNAVASSGVKFAWIKATEGGDRADARFQANWSGAKAAGVAHGAYHFVYWCRSPMEEMAFFEQNAPVEDDALPPVLDVEATPTSPTCHRHLTQEGATADMKVMLEEMERHYGKRPIIYTTVDFYEAILSDGAFMDYPIWVRSTKHHPAVKYGSRAWAFWQYQSDGQTPGINGNVDRDVFYGTKEQWDAFLREPKTRPLFSPPASQPAESAIAQSAEPSAAQALAQSSDASPEPVSSGASLGQ